LANIAVAIFKVNVATAMFAKTLVNTRNSTQHTPKSRSYTLNFSHENLRTRIPHEIIKKIPVKLKVQIQGEEMVNS
jgi:hypothetical protein